MGSIDNSNNIQKGWTPGLGSTNTEGQQVQKPSSEQGSPSPLSQAALLVSQHKGNSGTGSIDGVTTAHKPMLTQAPGHSMVGTENATAIMQNLNTLGSTLKQLMDHPTGKGLREITFDIMATLAKLQQEQRKQGFIAMQGARSAISVLGQQKIASMEKQADKTYHAALAGAISEMVGGVGGMIPLIGTGLGDAIKGTGSIVSAKLTQQADKANIEVTRLDQAINLRNKDYDMANDTWSNALSNFQAIKGAADQMLSELHQTQNKVSSNV